jgi:FKBP-type peptidyl-prolyl cis-trans isomerase
MNFKPNCVSAFLLLAACGAGETLPPETPVAAAPVAAAPVPVAAAPVAAAPVAAAPSAETTSAKTTRAQAEVPIAAAPLPTSSAAAPASSTPVVPTPSATPAGLQMEDLKLGTGMIVASGDRAKLHYTGRLESGTVFDTSLQAGREPFVFRVGKGQVIKGWDQGIVGMRIGGKRKLTIAPGLAYGAKGSPPTIPPNATLIFEVELLDVVKFGP